MLEINNVLYVRTANFRVRFSSSLENSFLVESTKNRRSFKLIYYEACISKEDAIRREKYLKTYHGKMYLRKRFKSYLTG